MRIVQPANANHMQPPPAQPPMNYPPMQPWTADHMQPSPVQPPMNFPPSAPPAMMSKRGRIEDGCSMSGDCCKALFCPCCMFNDIWDDLDKAEGQKWCLASLIIILIPVTFWLHGLVVIFSRMELRKRLNLEDGDMCMDVLCSFFCRCFSLPADLEASRKYRRNCVGQPVRGSSAVAAPQQHYGAV